MRISKQDQLGKSRNTQISRVLVAGLLLMVGCSAKEITTQSAPSSQSSSSQCVPAAAKSMASTSEVQTAQFRGNKLSPGLNLRMISSLASPLAQDLEKAGTTPQARVAKDAHLTLLVDTSCLPSRSAHHDLLDQVLATSTHSSAETLKNLARASDGQGRYLSLDWQIPREMELTEVQKLAQDDECVAGVGEAIEFRKTSIPNDPSFAQQSFHTTIQSALGWDTFFDATKGIQKDIVIAIIDCGVNIAHEDLSSETWVNNGEIPANGVDDDKNGYVDDVNGYNFVDKVASPEPVGTGSEHGTHVAGLAAAIRNNKVGVAGVMGQHVKIMGLNVFGASSGADTTNIDNAIRYAADNGAQVINMSLGGPGDSPTTLAAIQYAISKGVFVVAAAGNSTANVDVNTFTPAGYASGLDGMLAVGSVQSLTKKLSSFSNYGVKSVEIAAPGESGMLSTLPGNTYGTMNGTSMASPVVAGAAGLVYGLAWSRTGAKPALGTIKQLLMSSSEKNAGLTSKIKDGNLLNLANLASQVSTQFPLGTGSTNPPTCP